MRVSFLRRKPRKKNEVPWVFKSKRRLFITLLIVLIIPTLILTPSVFFLARRQLTEGAVYQNLTMAQLVANLIDEDFFGLRRYIESVGGRASITELLREPNGENSSRVLKEVVEGNKKLFRVELVNSSGDVISDYPHRSDSSSGNVELRAWFRGASKLDTPYVSDVHKSAGPGNPYVVTVAEKIKDKQSGVMGVLAGQYPITGLQQTIESIKPSVEGEIVIFDQRHQQIGISNVKLPPATILRVLNTKLVNRIFKIGNNKYFGSHIFVPSVGWNVLAYKPSAILFEPLYELIRAMLTLVVIVLLSTAVIGWQWHKTIFVYAAELKHSYDYLEGFCYSIAHDLYAPARAVRGFAGIMADEFGCQLGKTGCGYVNSIAKAGSRMTALVDGLLEYGSIAHIPIHLEFLDVRPIILGVAGNLESIVVAKSARIEVAPSIPEIAGDERVLEKIFIQLLSNALKFCKPGVPPLVKIWTHETRHMVRIWIEDNGIGIDPLYHEKVFDVFQTLNDRETYSGTGIGLAIARKGVERLGGKIGLNSKPSEGCAFWVDLPKE